MVSAPAVYVGLPMRLNKMAKYLRIVITTTTIWLCQPTLYYVDGYQDLGTLGHCQKSGCRNSPDRAEEEAYNGNLRGGSRVKKYVAEYEPQSESLPVIYPGELTFIVVFAVLILALRIKGNVYTSIQIWYDKICRTARRSLISLRAKSSVKGGAVVVASAGIRSRFISSSSAASLGSLVDLIGPDSEHDDLGGFDMSLDESNSSTDALNSSFHDVLSRSLRRRLSRNCSSGSLGESSCNSSQASSYNSESSVGMNVFAEEYDSDGASSYVEVGASAELPFRATEFARRASMDPPDSDTVMATTDVIPASIKIGGRKKPKNKIDNVDKTVLSKFLNNLTETHRHVSNIRSSVARSIDDNCSRKPSRRSTVDTALLSQSCIR
jgi:hypothetical protein